MKRLCKSVDISDLDFIKKSINDCLKNKKKNRNDVIRLFHKYKNTDNLAIQIQKEILERNLIFPRIWEKEIVDASSGKKRTIGVQHIKQQIYDYIAVNALEELTSRIGYYQFMELLNTQIMAMQIVNIR